MPALIRLLPGAAQAVACLLIAAMMLQICADVVSKLVTGANLPVNVEIVSHYYMVGIAFLPLAFAETRDGHISAEVFTQMLRARARRVFVAAGWVVSLAVYGVLAWRSFLDAEAKRQIGAFIFSQGLRLDIWPSYYFLPLGFGLMALVLAWRLGAMLAGRPDGFGEEA